jgi:hypothetical protein
MNKLLSNTLILILCLFGFLLKAQENSKIITSEPYLVVDGKKSYFNKGNYFYSIKYKRLNVNIQKYDPSSLKLIESKFYENALPEESKPIYVEEIGGKHYLFFVKVIKSRDKSEEKEFLYYREINLEDLSLDPEIKTVFEIPGRLKGYSNLNTYAAKYALYFSPDKSKFLIQYRKAPTERQNKESYEEFGLFVYDAKNMEEISGAEIAMPYVESDMTLDDIFLDNEGFPNLYIQNHNEDVNEILRFNLEIKNIEISKLPSTEKFDINFDLVKRGGDEVYLTSSLNKGKQIIVQNVKDHEFVRKIEFPDDIYAKYEKKARFSGFAFQKVINCEDDGYLLVTQEYWDTTVIRHDSQSGGGYTTYEELIEVYNGLIVIKINSDFELEWLSCIPHGEGDSFIVPKMHSVAKNNYELVSYRYNNNNGYFLYYVMEHPDIKITDDMSKRERKKVEKLRRGKFPVAYCDVVNGEDGSYETLRLFSIKNVNGKPIRQFTFDRLIVSKDGSIISEAYKGDKEDILIKSVLNK